MKEYAILVNELEQYNPELLDKARVLAITKADMLDDELMNGLREEINVTPYVFISSITGFGIDRLKDILWESMNMTAKY